MSIQTIRPADLHAKVNSGEAVELIDVRTPAEFQSLRATIARNTPLESLKPKQIMGERNGNASAPLYVICKSNPKFKARQGATAGTRLSKKGVK